MCTRSVWAGQKRRPQPQGEYAAHCLLTGLEPCLTESRPMVDAAAVVKSLWYESTSLYIHTYTTLANDGEGDDFQFIINQLENFNSLSHHQHLRFDHFPQEKLDSTIHKHFANLQWLQLFDPEIKTLEQGCFIGAKSLVILEISSSSIEKLERDAFVGLNSLVCLGISDAKYLADIELGAFNGLASLKHLTVTGSKVNKLEHGLFGELKNLISLDLSANSIEKL